MNWAEILWLVVLLLCLYLEASTLPLVSLWFALGALAALVAGLLGASVWVQVPLFFGVSVVTLLCLRPLLKKYFTPKLTRTNVDAVIGTRGTVIADIDNVAATGRIKLGGMEWAARSTTGNPIPAGTLATVDKIEGVKVFVTPVPVNNQEVNV